MECLKCHGFVFNEMEYYENGERVLDIHCIHCGERYYPHSTKAGVRSKGRNPNRRKDVFVFRNKKHWKEEVKCPKNN